MLKPSIDKCELCTSCVETAWYLSLALFRCNLKVGVSTFKNENGILRPLTTGYKEHIIPTYFHYIALHSKQNSRLSSKFDGLTTWIPGRWLKEHGLVTKNPKGSNGSNGTGVSRLDHLKARQLCLARRMLKVLSRKLWRRCESRAQKQEAEQIEPTAASRSEQPGDETVKSYRFSLN